MSQGPRSAGRGRDQTGAVARYRLRGVLRRGRAGYLAIVLITGLLGGVAMGSVAAARRTQSAFPRILAASNPSDLDVDPGRYTPQIMRKIAAMRHVTAARAYVAILGLRQSPDGSVDPSSDFNTLAEMAGSLNGLYFSQNRMIVTAGRRADPRRADQAMISDQTARRFGLHVGQVLAVNLYTQQQFDDPDANPETAKPVRQVRLTITGIGVFTDEVVQDDVDRIYRVLATPAFTRQVLSCCASYAWAGLQLDQGDRAVPAVQREFARLLPPGSPLGFRVTSVVEGQGERAIRPESVAAAVFGLIAALAAVVLAGQAIRRVLAAGRRERSVLRALGASPRVIAVDLGLPAAGAVLAGTVLAGLVAVAVSPVAPLGPMHRLDPQPGFAADWTVLGTGAAVLLLVLGAATALSAAGEAARTAGRRADRAARRGTASSAAARLNLPPGPAVGIGFAFGPAGDRSTRPAWAAITGTVVALVILVASVSFGASLGKLVSHPSLYGWTWDREMLAGSGYGDIPPGRLARALRADPDVAAWAGGYFDSVEINGHSVPSIGLTSTKLSPPVLAGHQLTGPGQIVLGAETLAEVGARIGGTVTVFNGRSTTRMTVAGTTTLPAIGIGHGIHPSLGRGALMDAADLPVAFRDGRPGGTPTIGPNTVLLRFRPGAGQATATRRLAALSLRLSGDPATLGVQVLPVQRPAEIVNYRSMGAAPVILAARLAAGAVVARAGTVATAARRRARDFALLRTLGFVRRQVVAVVIWQAGVCVAAGTLIGLPLGAAAGRFLWSRFAGQLYVVPHPAVPAGTIAAVGLGALLAAVLTAVGPGWLVARSPAAQVLRRSTLDVV
ncbi:MAG TPA: ABC transporter permease [Streptosporangiaceae bacterium]